VDRREISTFFKVACRRYVVDLILFQAPLLHKVSRFIKNDPPLAIRPQ
jgi:hypothetical protein